VIEHLRAEHPGSMPRRNSSRNAATGCAAGATRFRRARGAARIEAIHTSRGHGIPQCDMITRSKETQIGCASETVLRSQI
jgi:hypothetical protein